MTMLSAGSKADVLSCNLNHNMRSVKGCLIPAILLLMFWLSGCATDQALAQDTTLTDIYTSVALTVATQPTFVAVPVTSRVTPSSIPATPLPTDTLTTVPISTPDVSITDTPNG